MTAFLNQWVPKYCGQGDINEEYQAQEKTKQLCAWTGVQVDEIGRDKGMG